MSNNGKNAIQGLIYGCWCNYTVPHYSPSCPHTHSLLGWATQIWNLILAFLCPPRERHQPLCCHFKGSVSVQKVAPALHMTRFLTSKFTVQVNLIPMSLQWFPPLWLDIHCQLNEPGAGGELAHVSLRCNKTRAGVWVYSRGLRLSLGGAADCFSLMCYLFITN